MSLVKTAISMQGHLYEKMTSTAKELHVSRSRLMSVALQSYLEQLENKKMLEALNKAYEDQAIDHKELDQALENHSTLLENEKW